MTFELIAKQAKTASFRLQKVDKHTRNRALLVVRNALIANSEKIIEANQLDLKEALTLLENKEITPSMYNRLKLDENKMRDMIKGVEDIIMLDDPTGKTLFMRELDEGIILKKVTTPIGVIGIIFEARPDVITQISALAIKSSNVVILKGGKEAINTNKTIMGILNATLKTIENFPENVLNQVFTRGDVEEMLKADKYIDLIIPRGSNQLVKFIKDNTNIPVLGHADGICHIFVDEDASLDLAKNVITDSKCQYPSACNSVETILIHNNFLWKDELYTHLQRMNIELIFEPETYSFEYGEKKLAVKIVYSIDEAIDHINNYGSHHTDCILTRNDENANKFVQEVDSAGVYKNISTRFADGFRYGFGAEVGISTNKTHARGPVGLEGLVIYKYILEGKGQIVEDYASGKKHFHHKDLI